MAFAFKSHFFSMSGAGDWKDWKESDETDWPEPWHMKWDQAEWNSWFLYKQKKHKNFQNHNQQEQASRRSHLLNHHLPGRPHLLAGAKVLFHVCCWLFLKVCCLF